MLFLLDYYSVHPLRLTAQSVRLTCMERSHNTMKKVSFVLVMAFAMTFISQGAFADVNSEIEALKKGQAQMKKDLAEIKKLIKLDAAGDVLKNKDDSILKKAIKLKVMDEVTKED